MAIKPDEWRKINDNINSAIQKAVSPQLPKSGLRAVCDWLKLWGAISALWAVPLALMAFAASAMYVAVARVDKQARFEATTDDRLKAIEGQLKDIRGSIAVQSLRNQASLTVTQFKTSLPELRASLAAAKEQHLSVSLDVVNDIQQKLLAVDHASPGYWSATAQFINYRSYATSSDLQVGEGTTLPDCTDKEPTLITRRKINNGSVSRVFPTKTVVSHWIHPKTQLKRTFGQIKLSTLLSKTA